MTSTSTAASRAALLRPLARALGWALATGLPALAVMALPPTLWDEVTGLPGHPLVVHAAVVLVPVVAVLVGIAAVRPSLRPNLRRIVPPLLGLAAVVTVLAKRTGDSLSAAVGLPATHAEWGNNLVPLAIGLAVVGTLVLHLGRDRAPLLRRIDGVLSGVVALAAVAAVAMTAVVGHSGAEAVWDGVLDAARRPPASAADAPATITMADVARRSSPDECWTVVDGLVYDMTPFVARHPAGQEAIVEMCGRDATEDYREEHAGQAEPADWLAVFRIGVLSTG